MPDLTTIGAAGAGAGAGGLAALISQMFTTWLRREDKKAMHEKIERVDKKHDDLALYIARNHATKDDVKNQTERLEKSIDLLGAKIDKYFEQNKNL